MTPPCHYRARNRVAAKLSARRAISPRRLLQRPGGGGNIAHVSHDVGIAFEYSFVEMLERGDRTIAQTCVCDFGRDLARKLRTFGDLATFEQDLDDLQSAGRRLFGQSVHGEGAAGIVQIGEARTHLASRNHQASCSLLRTSGLDRSSDVIEQSNAVREMDVRGAKIVSLDRAI